MSNCPQCPTKTIIDPPVVVYENYYHPQVVQFIHPIEIIKQHHCVPIPQHIYTCTVKDQFCSVSNVKSVRHKVTDKPGTARNKKS